MSEVPPYSKDASIPYLNGVGMKRAPLSWVETLPLYRGTSLIGTIHPAGGRDPAGWGGTLGHESCTYTLNHKPRTHDQAHSSQTAPPPPAAMAISPASGGVQRGESSLGLGGGGVSAAGREDESGCHAEEYTLQGAATQRDGKALLDSAVRSSPLTLQSWTIRVEPFLVLGNSGLRREGIGWSGSTLLRATMNLNPEP